jgi:heat shock protein HtpX
MNYIKTFFLLVVLAGLLMIIGYFLGGQTGVVIALIFAIIFNFGSWFFSDKIVLSMYGAREVSEADAPRLYGMVKNLAQEANMPMPKVNIIPSPSPNAFATGRDPAHAAVAVTQGALDLLTYEELSGVMAHELTHVKNRDSLVMVIAATITAAIMFVSRFALWFGGGSRRDNPLGLIGLLLMVILAPLAAMLIQMAISRTREYGADRGGAVFSHHPEALASALQKISGVSQVRPQVDLAEPSTAHLWIASPLSGGGFMTLFSTHPPVQDRIRRLMKMAEEGV